MKKSIKVIAVSMTLMASLITLTACGSDKNDVNKKEENISSSSITQTEEKTNSVTNFLDDNSSYYFTYNGVKITAGDEMSKLSSANLLLRDTHREKEIKSKDRTGCEVTNSKDTSIFNITAYNKDSSTVTASNSWIGGISVDTRGVKRDDKVADMEVYGGIKIGSTVEELKKVFGEPDKDESSESEYVYESKEVSRYFRFDIEDGKVTGITWMNRIF